MSETPQEVEVEISGIEESCQGVKVHGATLLGWAPNQYCAGTLFDGGVSSGDSGGLRAEGRRFVLGIHSYTSGGTFDLATFVPNFFDWINDNASDSHPSYLPPSQVMAVL